MKKFLFTAAIASMAFVSASAQPGINQTTLWTFEQFQDGDNVASNVAVNYGNLYIVGRNYSAPYYMISCLAVVLQQGMRCISNFRSS